MKRNDLIKAIDDLKNSENIDHSVDCLKDMFSDFCDNYETDFNHIKDLLEDLMPHIEKVNEAYNISKNCSELLK